METSKNDTGLRCLTVLLRFHQVAVDPAQIAHEYSGEAIGVAEMLRCAKQLKLKARGVTENWAGLTKLPLPAIVEPRSGGVVIVGKVSARGRGLGRTNAPDVWYWCLPDSRSRNADGTVAGTPEKSRRDL